MTKATKWALLRKTYNAFIGRGLEETDQTLQVIKSELLRLGPSYVPSEPFQGDQGSLYFDDDSEIDWDWDNGDFYDGDERLEYPFYHSDPVFFNYSNLP